MRRPSAAAWSSGSRFCLQSGDWSFHEGRGPQIESGLSMKFFGRKEVRTVADFSAK
jgi:hypothetical protein